MNAIEYIAETRIQEAIEQGAFDNLSGFGKPVDNSEYFKVPEDERIAVHILRNAGYLAEYKKINR